MCYFLLYLCLFIMLVKTSFKENNKKEERKRLWIWNYFIFFKSHVKCGTIIGGFHRKLIIILMNFGSFDDCGRFSPGFMVIPLFTVDAKLKKEWIFYASSDWLSHFYRQHVIFINLLNSSYLRIFVLLFIPFMELGAFAWTTTRCEWPMDLMT